MRDGWRRVRLREVLHRSTELRGDADEPRVLTVTEGHGLVDQMEHWGRRVASADTSKYKIVRTGAIVYNIYLLWLGAIGRNTTGETAITSPVYEVFDVDSAVDARFIEHLLRSTAMVTEYMGISIGTVPRRRRTPWQAFLDVPVTIPPLFEQRRIVDLIAAVDDAIGAAGAEAEANERLRDRLRMVPHAGPLKHLGDLLTAIESGMSVATTASEKNGPRLLRISAVRHGAFDPGEYKNAGDAPLPGRARIKDGDLLMTRSNTPDRVGYVAIAEGIDGNYYIPDLIWRLVPKRDEVDARYLLDVLSSEYGRSEIMARASGTSASMQKISKARISTIPVPVPSLEAQAAYVAPIKSAQEADDSALATAEALRTLRSNLLTALLSGDHQIPSSYDRLLEGGAA